MGQTVAIHGNMPLDARDLFAAVITFLFGGIGALDALCINNHNDADYLSLNAKARRFEQLHPQLFASFRK
jgi:hypothetical protein